MDPAWIAVVQAVLTSYPFWGAVVVVVIVAVFRTPFVDFLNRAKQVGWGRAAIMTTGPEGPAQPPPLPDPAADLRAAGDDMLTRFDSPHVRGRIEAIRTDLEKRGLNVNPAEAVRVLTRITALATVHAEFATAEADVWGGQIRILEFLNVVPRAAQAQLVPIYEQVAAIQPATFKNYPFERYIEFLVGRGLVSRAQDGTYEITAKGRAYMVWRVSQRRRPRPN